MLEGDIYMHSFGALTANLAGADFNMSDFLDNSELQICDGLILVDSAVSE